MMDKINFVAMLVATLAITGCSCDGTGPTEDGEAPVVFGAALPLTGSGAVWGENARKGMELARAEINDSSGVNGQSLEVIYEDTQGLPQPGVAAIQKLITVDKVPAVMGCITSSTTLAMAPIAKQHEVVLFSPGASNPKLSEAGKYFFRNFPSDAIEAPEIARMVRNKLGLTKVAILLVNNEFGRGHEQSFRSEFEQLGGQIVATESFAQEGGDFRTQIAKIKSAQPEGVYLPGYPQEMATLLRQMAEVDFASQIICPSALIDEDLIKTAGETVEGVIFADQRPPDEASPVVQQFRRAFLERYNEEPGIVCDTSYDALRILAKCVEEGGDSGPQIQQQLVDIRDFPGAAGPTTFDENGDVTKTPIFKRVQNGKIELFWDNPPTEG